MKKNKFLSLFLVAVMVISCFYMVGTAASAATEGVVYFDNSITNFDSVKCGMWKDGEDAEFNFEDMTNTSGDVWSYEYSGEFDKIVFTDGTDKSAELDFEGDGKIAQPKSWQDGFDVVWSDYSADITSATQADFAKKEKTKTGAGAATMFCKNDAKWSTVYCYMWNSDSDKNASWPGVAMKDTGDDVWEYTPTKTFSKVIFNGGNNGPQTSDLDAPSDVKIYNNSSNSWEPYSVGPVKITSFKTGVESPSYTNVSVVISAAATSTAGAVSYKFSVKDSASTSVLSDGASSTVAWIPTKAGKYTIMLDVTDTAGNKESRTLAFEIQDASSLESAFITAFTNSLGTNKTILQNSNVTFTTNAIGGKIGTNLLFYKFLITGPDSKTNIAYYTTGNTYTYKPTALGTYTVEAFVQNSYNDTVSHTYTFNCATSIPADDKDNPVQPVTNPQPATQATTENQGGGAATTPQGPTVPDAKLGDVNRDGNINIKDVTLIQKNIAFMVTLDAEQKTLADVNKDGNVNIKDATTIQKFIAYMITSF